MGVTWWGALGSVVLVGCSPHRACPPGTLNWMDQLCLHPCPSGPGSLCYPDGGQVPDAFLDVGDVVSNQDATDTSQSVADVQDASLRVDAADVQDAAPPDSGPPLLGSYMGFEPMRQTRTVSVWLVGGLDGDSLAVTVGSTERGQCPTSSALCSDPSGAIIEIDVPAQPGPYTLGGQYERGAHVDGQRCNDIHTWSFASGAVTVQSVEARLGGRVVLMVNATWPNGDHLAGTLEGTVCVANP